MNINQEFNAMHGTTVSRKTLENLLERAEKEKNTIISKRVIKVLKAFDDDSFIIEIVNLVEPFGLNAPRHTGEAKKGLDNCGRLKNGYKYKNGTVVKVAKNVKKMHKKERNQIIKLLKLLLKTKNLLMMMQQK